MSATILPIVGLVIGAILQFLFTRHLDGKKHQRELRAKAYTDYLTCVSEYANLTAARNSPEAKNLATRTADAKCRVCLYGAQKTVEAFAAFERLGAAMKNDTQCAAFTELVSQMRADSSGQAGVAADDLQTVLLGVRRDAT
ncbi:hypothetical protein [Rhodoferax saidenbachensis]|uniref:Serine/threonine protein kinase n=1 Tax=Rhodoferax saidenbachensis TaxID=1484693 RepID=A0ABU1ZH81_9BURK|nr:hypothetical protein [Rhodoferax saidenbachensis]MDR7304895.1 hypothetical protein [Rhodoferax saidenbachensis]